MNTLSFKAKKKLIAGDILSRDILDADGNILLYKNSILDENSIELLLSEDYVSLVPVLHNYNQPNDNIKTVQQHSNSYINYYRKMLSSDIEELLTTYVDKNDITVNVVSDILKKIVSDIVKDDNLIYEVEVIKNFSEDMYMHSITTAVFALLIGIMAGLSEEELVIVGTAGIFSNIGKTTLPKALVNKLSKLTDEEVESVKQYTTYGYNIIKGCKTIDNSIADAIYTMREKYDGTGYPRGLKGEEIPIYGQILCISTYLSALIGKTLYKKTLDPYTASKMMVGESGISFNPELVVSTMKILGFYEVGMTVKLKNGEIARVVSRNRFSPKVRIISSSSIKDLEIDLENNRGIKIKEIKLSS